MRNQELFGGDYWTRTSDLLHVKMRQGRKQRKITPLSALFDTFYSVYGNSIMSTPLFPPDFFHSGSPFGSGTQIASHRESSTAREGSYNSQGSRSMQVEVSLLPSKFHAAVSFNTVSQFRKVSSSRSGANTPPFSKIGFASSMRMDYPENIHKL